MSYIQEGLNRRLFLIRGAQVGAALTLGMSLGGRVLAANAETGDFEPNAFVTIQPDNTVVITIKHLEMGQGTFTGLATIVAEELDADWSQVKSFGAPANTKKYANLAMGLQLTGGSTAIANSYTQMREAGATARAMLLAAAGQRWNVAVSSLGVQSGTITHSASGRHASFGELAAAAAKQPLPKKISLKDPSEFVLIGKAKLGRKDSGKTDGTAIFTQDVQRPGMLTAVVVHPPLFGATLKSVDASNAKALPGVRAVVQIPSGVAVLADSFWQAKKGRDALKLQWQGGSERSSEDIIADYKKLASKPGLSAVIKGDVSSALSNGEHLVDVEFEFPFLAHAAMEPMNCALQKTALGVDMWYGCQAQSWDQQNVAKVFGLAPEAVTINTLYAGGSFGRRATMVSDYAVELAEIVKAWGGSAPVKLVWTREDDTASGYYRPMYVHSVKASLNVSGELSAWQQRIVGQSIMGASDSVDHTTVEGASNLPYAIANLSVEAHNTNEAVPISWWRSVGSTHTAFAVETVIDELAQKAGRDPVAFRLALLKDEPRYTGVLKLVAEKAQWGKPLPDGHFHGVALHKSFGTYVAQVAEIAAQKDGKYKIVKVTCAVDCGVAINPDVIAAQMEGGIGFGLSPFMFSEITLKDGKPAQQNFDSYKVVRMRHMPHVDVHIVPSAEAPSGVGEPGTPVVAPAVANALFAATGKRVRKLPAGEDFFTF
ncbi:xanthine dehydrogenase family protein molybdopterin-binding subunit [Zhongshania sp. BJYM1]|uniref:xanthine dehydrogenase family protein molybdopterin-binding subunit n=1 Tax=Zhongshania aquatica TaxID=2965069 RepID=UPI0022B42FA7|nr:xanthine dehydrogenase family protein molybdopterin-binding subunit [Marortus sp. BJYM1]